MYQKGATPYKKASIEEDVKVEGEEASFHVSATEPQHRTLGVAKPQSHQYASEQRNNERGQLTKRCTRPLGRGSGTAKGLVCVCFLLTRLF